MTVARAASVAVAGPQWSPPPLTGRTRAPKARRRKRKRKAQQAARKLHRNRR